MLTRNTSYIKVAELLEHQIACHQNLYKDYDQKLSAYLDFSPHTKHQIRTMNKEYPRILQGSIMRMFGAGYMKEKPCRVMLNDMRIIGNNN